MDKLTSNSRTTNLIQAAHLSPDPEQGLYLDRLVGACPEDIVSDGAITTGEQLLLEVSSKTDDRDNSAPAYRERLKHFYLGNLGFSLHGRHYRLLRREHSARRLSEKAGSPWIDHLLFGHASRVLHGGDGVVESESVCHLQHLCCMSRVCRKRLWLRGSYSHGPDDLCLFGHDCNKSPPGLYFACREKAV